MIICLTKCKTNRNKPTIIKITQDNRFVSAVLSFLIHAFYLSSKINTNPQLLPSQPYFPKVAEGVMTAFQPFVYEIL